VINGNVWQGRKEEFANAIDPPGPATIRKIFQVCDTGVDRIRNFFLRQLGCLFEYGAPRVQASSALPATNEFPSGSKQSFDSRANFPMAHEVAALQRIQPSLQLRQIVLRIEIVPDHGLRQFFGITPGSARRASRALPLVQE